MVNSKFPLPFLKIESYAFLIHTHTHHTTTYHTSDKGFCSNKVTVKSYVARKKGEEEVEGDGGVGSRLYSRKHFQMYMYSFCGDPLRMKLRIPV